MSAELYLFVENVRSQVRNIPRGISWDVAMECFIQIMFAEAQRGLDAKVRSKQEAVETAERSWKREGIREGIPTRFLNPHDAYIAGFAQAAARMETLAAGWDAAEKKNREMHQAIDDAMRRS